MNKRTYKVTAPALLAFIFSSQALAQGVAPPPPGADDDDDSSVAPPPPVPPPTEEKAERPRPRVEAQTSVVAPPPSGGAAPAPTPASEDEISGPPSDLPYYVPQGAERLPAVEAPEVPPPPAPPSVKFGVGPLFRYHRLLNGFGGYAEIGATFRLSSTGVGFSSSFTTFEGAGVGSVNFGFETPILVGIPVYTGPVTVAIVPRAYAQLEYFTGVGGSAGMNLGALPSVQVAGCQGIPWYFNVGPHLTAKLIALPDGADPVAVGTAGFGIETGVLFF